jgi:hypothetical protein
MAGYQFTPAVLWMPSFTARLRRSMRSPIHRALLWILHWESAEGGLEL